MACPLDPDDDMQRMILRKREATAKGGHAYQRLLQLTETRDSGQVQHAVALLEAQPRINLAAALSRLAQ